MVQFKVGDTLAFVGVVTEVDDEPTASGKTLLLIRWPSGDEDWLFDCEVDAAATVRAQLAASVEKECGK